MTTAPSASASVGSRVAAYAIDSVVATVVLAVAYILPVIGFVNGSSAVLVVGLLLFLVVAIGYPVVYVVHEGRTGATPGKRVVGIRTVDATTGRPIGVWRAFVRQLVLGLLGPLNLIQLFTIPGHSRRQGWHDRAADSVVLRADVLAGDTLVGRASSPGLDEPSLGPRSPAPWPSPSVPNLATAPPAAPPTGPPTAPPTAPLAASLAAPLAAPPSATAMPPAGDVTHRGPAPAALSQVGPPPGVQPPPTVSPAPSVPDDSEDGTVPPVVPPPPGATPSVAAPVSAAGEPTPPVEPLLWALQTSTGQRHQLDGPLLAGRDPDAGLVAGATVWVVDDPGLSVSKTHARFGLDGAGPWVEDWHSTNGTTLHRQDAVSSLTPHTRTELREGDTLTLGDLRLVVSRGPR